MDSLVGAEVDLICVGDVMLDVRVQAGALAEGGDVHGRVRVHPGGTSANAAVWAAWSGASARVVGRVGDDIAGRMLGEQIRARGVETSLALDGSEPTGTMLVVHTGDERSMVADRGANGRLLPADLPRSLKATSVLVSGYLLLHEGTNEAAVAALERAQGRFVAVEASSWPLVRAFGSERFLSQTERANVLLANEREAEVLTGSSGQRAANTLGESYRHVFVKLGSKGAIAVSDGLMHSVHAEQIDQVDTTGAGDAFDGVLLAALGAGRDVDDALAAACRVGAQVAGADLTWPELPH
jgi:sugar/nucleoside kinase (ribokinase family)